MFEEALNLVGLDAAQAGLAHRPFPAPHPHAVFVALAGPHVVELGEFLVDLGTPPDRAGLEPRDGLGNGSRPTSCLPVTTSSSSSMVASGTAVPSTAHSQERIVAGGLRRSPRTEHGTSRPMLTSARTA